MNNVKYRKQFTKKMNNKRVLSRILDLDLSQENRKKVSFLRSCQGTNGTSSSGAGVVNRNVGKGKLQHHFISFKAIFKGH